MNLKKGLLYHIEKYRFNSIFLKTFAVALIISLSLGGLFSFYVYRNARSVMESEMYNINRESLMRVKNAMDGAISTVSRISINLSMQNNIRSFALGNEKNVDIGHDILKDLKNHMLIYPYIDSIYVYSKKNGYVIAKTKGDSQLYVPFDSFEDVSWYDSCSHNKGKESVIISRKKNDDYPFLFTVIYLMNFDDYEDVGAVVVNLDIVRLNDILKDDMNSGGMQKLLLLSQNDTVLYSPEQKMMFTNLNGNESYQQLAGLEETFSGRKEIDGQKALVSVVESNFNAWKYISYIPETYFSEQISSMQRRTIVVCIILFIVALIISGWITFRTYQPVKNILTLVDYEDKGNTQTSKYFNEIDYINNKIFENQQRKDGKQNVEQIFVSNNRAQISALHSQIKSHFLYNMLSTIQWKAIKLTGDENEVSTMIHQLGQFFKINMDINGCILTVEEETENAKIYTELLIKRYQDVFDINWDISDDVLECKIINICLQPLIENAVYHGVKLKEGKGRIKISVFEKENMLHLVVEDDGVGMSAEKLMVLNNKLNNYLLSSENEHEEGEHVGLFNVNKRLKLMFGEQSGIHIESVQEQGTRVEIFVPKII